MIKKVRRIFLLLILAMLSSPISYISNTNTKVITEAAETTHWYSQKGLVYNGKTLTSMCYITDYAMIINSMGIKADPISVYVANGCSNYANHTKIAKAFGVNSSELGSLTEFTEAQKKEKIKALVKQYPQGIIVGGSYGNGSTHYIVAKKVVDDIVYFDDPAYATESQGCCIPIENVWKLNWSNLSMYRIIKLGETAKETSTPSTVAPSTVAPLATVKPTIPDEQVPTTEVSAIPPVQATATPLVQKNPLGTYTVPTRTVYYKNPLMTGDDVKWVQLAMTKLGYEVKIDGSFDSGCKTKVIKLQQALSLSADGYVGAATRAKMISELEGLEEEKKLETVTVKKVTKLSVKSKSVKPASSLYKAALTWKAQKDAEGYQVTYALQKDFSHKTKLKVTKNAKVIKSLEKGKTYYFKVRAYKMVDGKRKYGKYSAVKTLKIKQ